jgi:hypothetical protein
LTDTQIESCATALQKAIAQLGNAAKEIADGNIVLDAKKGGPHGNNAGGDDEPKSDASEATLQAGVQLMDLDQAIAAGLIPPSLLDKK